MFPIIVLAALAAGAMAQDSTSDADGVHVTMTATFDHQFTPRDTGALADETATFVTSPPTGTPTSNPHGHTMTMPKGVPPPNQIIIPAIGFLDDGYVGSVREVDKCSTTVILRCAETSNPNEKCGSDSNFKATMTKGPDEYKLQFSTKMADQGRLMDEKCFVGDTGMADVAVCVYSDKPDGFFGTSVISTPMSAFLPITAGAKKLPTGDAICETTVIAAAPTGILEIKKVVVPLVLAAGAQALL